MNKKLISAIFEVVIPDNMDEEYFVKLTADYLMFNRFVNGEVKVNAYPPDYNLQITSLITGDKIQ